MKLMARGSLGLVLAAFLLQGCGSKEPQQAPAAQSPQPTAQPAQPAPTPAEPAPAKKETPAASTPPTAPAAKTPAPAPTPMPPAKAPAAPSTPPPVAPVSAAPSVPSQAAAQKPPPAEQPAPTAQVAKVTPKDVIILKAPLGGVRFQHKVHVETRKVACEKCHHPSRPEKPATAPQQACGTCHTSTAMPPMKTKLQAAFHNPTATAGLCIDCHKAQNATGRAAPVKCLDCHKKENG